VGKTVDYRIELSGGTVFTYTGATWRFSDNAGSMASKFSEGSTACCFSDDDAAWGGASGTVDGNDEDISSTFFGQGSFNSGDSDCTYIYQEGNSVSNSGRSLMYVISRPSSPPSFSGGSTSTGFSRRSQSMGFSGRSQSTGFSGGSTSMGFSGRSQSMGFSKVSTSIGFSGGSLPMGFSGRSQSKGFSRGSTPIGFSGGSTSMGFSGRSQSTGFSRGSTSIGFSGGSTSMGSSAGSLSMGFSGGSMSQPLSQPTPPSTLTLFAVVGGSNCGEDLYYGPQAVTASGSADGLHEYFLSTNTASGSAPRNEWLQIVSDTFSGAENLRIY
jgi:hypothetical protein